MATASQTMRLACQRSPRYLPPLPWPRPVPSPTARRALSTTAPRPADTGSGKRPAKGGPRRPLKPGERPWSFYDEVVKPLTPTQVQWLEENVVKRRAEQAAASSSQDPLGLKDLDGEGGPPKTVQEFFERSEGRARTLDAARDRDTAWTRDARPNKKSFWYDEDDPDQSEHEPGEDFDEDDITTMAHGKLDEIRDMREWERVIAWELPLLSKLAKEYEPPTSEHVLRFRYTTYMGEFHPAERKVVVQFCPADLGLTAVQEEKLKKLAGPRYNPETDVVKMNCESFDHQAQNKRFLLDTITKLVEAAKDPTDTMEDIPLDTRHHKSKAKPRFPKEWYVTEERKQQLTAEREAAALVESARREKGLLIDGPGLVEKALASQAAAEAAASAGSEELVGVPAGRSRRARTGF